MRIRDITEAVGRITKQNQTVDVGPDEVTKQAAKFGNKVDKDGRPPTLSKKVKGKSTNVAFNLGMVEGKQIPNPKNTFLSKSDTAYDFIRVGKSISNLSNAKKSDNRDEPDVMIVPFGGKKEKDHLKKGLKKAGYKTQDADKPGDDAQVDENFAEGYKLQLERDKEMLVLNITDTASGKRTEVRGKPGYETGNYDPSDKLHQLLDKVGKSADISQLMNGEPVGINPKHPDGASAKDATDKAYSENFADGKKKGKSRPGRVKKSGASCNGSVTALRKRAKNASGEKAKMYHWCANMKSGRKKK